MNEIHVDAIFKEKLDVIVVPVDVGRWRWGIFEMEQSRRQE